MLQTLRDKVTPREGSGPLPALLLEIWARYLEENRKNLPFGG